MWFVPPSSFHTAAAPECPTSTTVHVAPVPAAIAAVLGAVFAIVVSYALVFLLCMGFLTPFILSSMGRGGGP